ncbi:nucleoporin autopeptidase [Oesophagostomum dentatum]|uniref:Nuclear pore complex protein Nup98-Nup96 n=1 Tax=Oesophagostomum dentatum TaxID=61180 RepID=A0A0B1T9S0_OESDE|nr:nucleoporin autopeptidase [Oesophagostomum dentatum]
MFGKSTFGSTGSTFGSTGKIYDLASLFGQNKPTTNLFGQQSSPAQGSLFGQKSTTNLFGSTTGTTGTSIFGSSNTSSTGTSLFGQSKPSLFGGSSTTGGTSLFGSSSTSTGGGLFGSTASTVNGTTIKFEPLISSDTMMKNGSQTTISTKHMCITAMKAYEGKSLEVCREHVNFVSMTILPTEKRQQRQVAFSEARQERQAQASLAGFRVAFVHRVPRYLAASQRVFSALLLLQQLRRLVQQAAAFSAIRVPRLLAQVSQQAHFLEGQLLVQLLLHLVHLALGVTPVRPPRHLDKRQHLLEEVFSVRILQPAQGVCSVNLQLAISRLEGHPILLLVKPLQVVVDCLEVLRNQADYSVVLQQVVLFSEVSLLNKERASSVVTSLRKPPCLVPIPRINKEPQQLSCLVFSCSHTILPGFGAAAPTTIQVPAAAPIVLGSDVNQAQVQMALLDAQIAASPYGDSPLLKLATAKDTDEMPNPINAQRQLKFLAAKSAASSPLNISAANGNTTSPSLNGSTISVKSSFLPVVPPKVIFKVADTCKPSPRVRSAVIPGRDLNYTSHVAPPTLGKGIRTKSINGTASLTNRSLNGSLINKTVDSAIETSLTGGTNKPPNSGRRGNLKYLDLSTVVQVINSRSGVDGEANSQTRDPDELPATDEEAVVENNAAYSPETDPREAAIQRGQARRAGGEPPPLMLDGSACDETLLTTNKSPMSEARTTASVTSLASSEASPRTVTSSNAKPIVRLVSPDYFTEPTINAMKEMVVNGKVVLNNGLTVGRATYGSVFWPGRIELENVTLDELVVFRHKEVTVYPDESIKPPLGEGLNRPAEVTLERVWYVDRATKEEIRDPLKLIDVGWRDRLEKITARMGATFKDYRPSTGSWVFRVEHFSKYGVPDDDDEGDVATVPTAKKPDIPHDVSVHDLDVSMEEQRVQSQVQRAKVPLLKLRNGTTEIGDHEQIKGLGGRIDSDYDNEMMYDDYDIANWRDEVPEKKPKIDMEVLDYVYEESKRLLELSTISARPVQRIILKCKEPSNRFTGGTEARKSVGYKKSCVMNLACARGSSCRIYAILTLLGGQFVFSQQPKSNNVRICALQYDSNVPKQLIVDMLEHNIRLSRAIRRNTSTSARVRHCEIEGQTTAPRLKPAEDMAAQLLDSYLATATQSKCTVQQRVWKLCQALFRAEKTDTWQWQRTQDVGDWLREEVANLSKKNLGRDASQVWSLLCAGGVDEAMRVASEAGMRTLSLMISSALAAEHLGRQSCAKMVEMWETDGELGVMEDDLVKIYLVLAGRSHAEFLRKGKMVKLNCLEGLDWRQAFGIHLWYINSGGFLEDAVESFSDDVKAGRAASPDSHVYDQLIRLACSPSHQVEAVLDAAAMLSPNPLDAHLSWHLWSVLRALGYHTMLPAAEQRLHISYATQLSSSELWHLAVFVLSHISHDQCRSVAIQEVLDRMSLTARSQQYEKILAICEIPKEWISAAKFIKAKAQGNLEAACSHALSAGNYASALQLFADEVAPNAIAMGDLQRLRPLAERMEKAADRIAGWGAIGQIYADYCMLKTMDDMDDTEENEEKLHQLVESISTRIMAPIFKTPIQRLCMKTMARELLEIQRLAGKREIDLPLSLSQLRRLAV